MMAAAMTHRKEDFAYFPPNLTGYPTLFHQTGISIKIFFGYGHFLLDKFKEV